MGARHCYLGDGTRVLVGILGLGHLGFPGPRILRLVGHASSNPVLFKSKELDKKHAIGFSAASLWMYPRGTRGDDVAEFLRNFKCFAVSAK